MFINTFFRRIIFNIVFLLIIFFINFFLFRDIYLSNNIIFSFAIHPFNICEKYPTAWIIIKYLYIPITFISSIIIINIIYSYIFSKQQNDQKNFNQKKSDLYINIYNEKNNNLIISEYGLYQNFLITGTIGSGKTSSVMYPFTKQLIAYKNDDLSKKLGMLILDVKGNYYSQVKKYVSYYNRLDDLIIIEIRSENLNIILLISQI